MDASPRSVAAMKIAIALKRSADEFASEAGSSSKRRQGVAAASALLQELHATKPASAAAGASARAASPISQQQARSLSTPSSTSSTSFLVSRQSQFEHLSMSNGDAAGADEQSDMLSPTSRRRSRAESNPFVVQQRAVTPPPIPSATLDLSFVTPRRSPRLAAKKGSPPTRETAADARILTPLRKLRLPEDDSVGGGDDYFVLSDEVLADLPMELLSQAVPRPANNDPIKEPAKEEAAVAVNALDDLDDLLSNMDWDDLPQQQQTPQHPQASAHRQQPQRIPAPPRPVYFERYLVLDVHVSLTQMTLKVLQERSKIESFVILQDEWAQATVVHIGDYVGVVGPFDEQRQCVVNAKQNLLVVSPDTLISGTTLADAFPCARKPVLAELHRGASEVTPALIYGSMAHLMFERAIHSRDFDTDKISNDMTALIEGSTERLYAAKVDEAHARQTLGEFITPIQAFGERYVSAQPKTLVRVDGRLKETGHEQTVAVCKVVDIEENIWSPTYGLKGKIDATVQVKIHKRTIRQQQPQQQQPLQTKQLIVPLELKTGRDTTSAGHRAQLILYTLLLSDRYSVNVDSGMLFYLKTGELIRIPTSWSEVSSLIMQRNTLARHIARNEIPKMTPSEFRCTRCHEVDRCVVYHKLVENGNEATSELGALFTSKTNHLLPMHSDFLTKWVHLISLETGDVHYWRKQIWLNRSSDRELHGQYVQKNTG